MEDRTAGARQLPLRIGIERAAALRDESLSTKSRALLTGPAAIATLPCYRVRVVPILQEVVP